MKNVVLIFVQCYTKLKSIYSKINIGFSRICQNAFGGTRTISYENIASGFCYSSAIMDHNHSWLSYLLILLDKWNYYQCICQQILMIWKHVKKSIAWNKVFSQGKFDGESRWIPNTWTCLSNFIPIGYLSCLIWGISRSLVKWVPFCHYCKHVFVWCICLICLS